MTDQERKYLADIISAIDLIDSFTFDLNGFEDYENDLKTQSAVERQLGVIGEAVNQFDKFHPSSPFEHARRIVGFRNRIIHAYDAIDNSMVWVILKKYLTPLRFEVEHKLKE